jgi:hypothetical protein
MMLAASNDDAGGDTFRIHKFSLQKVSYNNPYVVPRFCMNDARSIK